MVVRGGEVTYRYEVHLRDHGWVQYSANELAVDEEDLDAELAGTHTMPEVWQGIVEFARDELDRALGHVAAVQPGLDGFDGLRILAWDDESVGNDPAVVISATADQLAVGRLRHAATEVRDALIAVRDARERLRAQLIEATAADHLGRNQIARAVSGALARRMVLQYLSGYDTVLAIRHALPANWSTYSPHQSDWDWDYPPWRQWINPFWCGYLRICIEPTGQVHVELSDEVEEPDIWNADLTHEQARALETEHARRRYDRALTRAEVVVPALQQAGLRLLTTTGKAAEPADLTSGTIYISRLPGHHESLDTDDVNDGLAATAT